LRQLLFDGEQAREQTGHYNLCRGAASLSEAHAFLPRNGTHLLELKDRQTLLKVIDKKTINEYILIE
jgi:hypothetical protein